jgi:hypothetical protein
MNVAPSAIVGGFVALVQIRITFWYAAELSSCVMAVAPVLAGSKSTSTPDTLGVVSSAAAVAESICAVLVPPKLTVTA